MVLLLEVRLELFKPLERLTTSFDAFPHPAMRKLVVVPFVSAIEQSTSSGTALESTTVGMKISVYMLPI